MKLQFPIVINIPQTINVPTSGGTGTGTGTGTSTDDGGDEDSELSFEELADGYFNSKQPDGSYTLPSSGSSSGFDFYGDADKYFNGKG